MEHLTYKLDVDLEVVTVDFKAVEAVVSMDVVEDVLITIAITSMVTNAIMKTTTSILTINNNEDTSMEVAVVDMADIPVAVDLDVGVAMATARPFTRCVSN